VTHSLHKCLIQLSGDLGLPPSSPAFNRIPGSADEVPAKHGMTLCYVYRVV
jgi:hypothetical protein